MRKRSAFTLIEVLIVMSILVVLAGVVYPIIADTAAMGGPTTMANTVRQVREQITYHAAVGDVPLSAEGHPNTIDPAWFAGGRLPEDAWTYRPLNIQVVHGAKDQVHPNNKSYQLRPDGQAAGHTAWYNASNGAFCARVPRIGTPDEILATYNYVNNVVEMP
ncbi:MAG: type II secretion system protein [Planctomycetota bacterium]